MKTCKKSLSLILSLLFVLTAAGSASLSALAVDAQPAVTVKFVKGETTANYKQTQYYEFEAENLPLDAELHVFLNGEDKGASTYIYVQEPTEDFTVEAKVLSADGSVQAESGEINVHVKNGVFDKIVAFFKKTFGTIADAVADILGAIFMTIWVFLHR